MTRIAYRLIAAFAAIAMTAAITPPARAQVLASVKGVSDPAVMLAITASGDPATLVAIEKVATAKGLKSGRITDNGPEQVMIVVPTDMDPAAFWPFYRDLLSGRYGKAVVGAILVARNQDPEAKDYLDHARQFTSSEFDQAPAPSRFMAGTKDHPAPMVVLGLIATGAETDMARVETEAGKAGFRAVRSKGDKGEPDVMVVVTSKDDPAKFWSLWRSASTGRLGRLSVELITVPSSFDPDMETYLDHARLYDASQVIAP